MTKDEFLARCENIYNMGLATQKRLALLNRWIDFVLRFEGGQMDEVARFMERETHRLNGLYGTHTLANDRDGYALFHLAAILSHHCQECATDPEAWHTRPGFCEHKGFL